MVKPLVGKAYVEFAAAGTPADDQTAGMTCPGWLLVIPAVLALAVLVEISLARSVLRWITLWCSVLRWIGLRWIGLR